ncbi:leucyl aminopeptidase family protein [Mycoplasma enhydrae]|uniref:M17 family metallopeptidase n=1 Tax=Mycoplasma enhydrae TaxID=2499220 RepID=UPI00197C43D0|nr:leucyl aminopeptidase family protein [Mycoplasma enhydrae]MBN4089360.1 leucyl aminopeptidase family protein [Mycoplasma enhydrae]MCV3733732.1 leucyl aminopeptidase family protein [Mycoplasma enhydrae]MCV3753594.1 leucyl aminopeptidase family protein [Mycoplasma enhydrae]
MELIKQLETRRNASTLLKAIFKEDKLPLNLVQKQNAITEYISENVAYVYMGKKEDIKYDSIYDLAINLGLNAARDYQIDLESFAVEKKICIYSVTDAFTKGINFSAAKLFNKKTVYKKENKNQLSLYIKETNKELINTFEKAKILVEAQNWARNLGLTPPNELNSEQLAEITEKELRQYKNLSINVLTKKEIEKLGMGLLLSVNRGSTFEPRVVVIEYTGNKASKEKTVLIGKGITFDSGGYNIKTGRYMNGMKYDMSGSAVVAAVMKVVAQLKPNTNVSAVMCITDNRVNGDASLPDSVWTSMSGKTVEVNNTDAEGRLVMADGLYYGATHLNATRLIDVATLTGAMIMALGDTYTGVWSTSDKGWQDVKSAAKIQNELVWRMPLDDEYLEYMKGSLVADLKNTDFTGKAGSSSAAMFLKEFTNGVEHIHFDIAGTCDVDEQPMFAMVKTISELVLK